jgi:peptidyl-prolyl cis-trans isomerase D
MAKKKKNTASNIAVWIILLLLIVGLAGFGATNFGGSVNAVGTVGDTRIGVNRYARELQQEINRLSQQFGTNLTFAQAQAFGIDRAVLQRIIGTVALENEAERIGLSAGDDRVRDELTGMTAFQGVDGSFDREGYRFALERSGLTEAEFEETLRRDIARGLLQAAVSGGTDMPAAFTDALIAYQRETRDITWAALTAEDLDQPIPDPAEEELRAYWEENEADFMLPEARQVTYAWITPEMVAETLEPEEDALRRLYEARAEDFNQPERRLVERLIFASDEAAAEAMAALQAGETEFEDLVEARGLSLADVDLGDVTPAELGAAAEPVFALEEPGIVGPVETDLGPALLRMNGILAAQVTEFEEARPQLVDEYAGEAARGAIGDMIDIVEDLLAGGATLEEIAEETELQLGQIAYVEGSEEAIAAYGEFRDAALAAEPGDFPELVQASDGAIFALRLDEVTEPRVEPFEEARERVEAEWVRTRVLAALTEKAEALAAELEAGFDPLAPAPEPVEEAAAEEQPVPQGPPADVVEDVTETPAEETDAEVTVIDPAEEPAAEDTAEAPLADDAPAEETEAEVTVIDPAGEPAAEDTAEDTPAAPALTWNDRDDVTRTGFVPDTPDTFVPQVFEMDEGEARVIQGVTSVYVVRLDAVTAPDLADDALATQAEQMRAQLAQAVGADILEAYATALEAEAGITLNQPALNAVHAQFQ